LEIKVSQFTINIDSREKTIDMMLFVRFNKLSPKFSERSD